MSPVSGLSSVGVVNPSVPNPLHTVFFTPYQRQGVAVMAVAGVTSCALVSILLLYITITALSPWPKRHRDDPPSFTSKQIAVFVICLLISDLIQSISGITQVKWAMENRIYEGTSCSLQAATLVMGDLGSTVWSCVIAAHTFSGLALGKQWPRWAVKTTVVIGWSFVIILTTIGPTTLTVPSKGPFYSIAGTWCFISSEYAIPRLGIHYVPLFCAALLILVLYGLVFLVLRGSISFNQPNFRTKGTGIEEFLSRERIIVAKRMLWYPAAYLTCILPIAIIRLVGLRQENVPESVWIFGMFFLFALGAVDSVIYTTTRKLIKPISFPTHLRTFSSENSGNTKGVGVGVGVGGGGGSPSSAMSRNLSFASKPPRFDDVGRDSDESERKDSGEFAQPPPPSPPPPIIFAREPSKGTKSKTDSFDARGLGAIHVTLERIQEII